MPVKLIPINSIEKVNVLCSPGSMTSTDNPGFDENGTFAGSSLLIQLEELYKQ
jgi:hypothetical protein